MKILIVSDTESNYIWDHFDKNRFKDIDCVISCGDLKAKYLSFLVSMLNVPLYYVHGNHDESYVKEPPQGCVSIDDDLIHFKGLTIAGLGGSPVYRRGVFQFSERQMAKRVAKLRKKLKKAGHLDIWVTHSPARDLGDGQDHAHIGFQCFRDFVDDLRPTFHLHGHQHLNYGRSERLISHGPTTIINGHGYYILDVDEPA